MMISRRRQRKKESLEDGDHRRDERTRGEGSQRTCANAQSDCLRTFVIVTNEENRHDRSESNVSFILLKCYS